MNIIKNKIKKHLERKVKQYSLKAGLDSIEELIKKNEENQISLNVFGSGIVVKIHRLNEIILKKTKERMEKELQNLVKSGKRPR